MKKLIENLRARADSWYNAYTGLGDALRDKFQSTQFLQANSLSDTMLENLYHGEDMAARIVEALPEEALREGYFLAGDDGDLVSALKEYEKKINFSAALEDCAVWARLFGGCAIFLGIDDGLNQEIPVAMEQIKTIKFADVLDKRYLTVESYNSDTDSTNYGKPEIYRIDKGDGTGSSMVHESRLLIMHGARTTKSKKERNAGWSDSVLLKVHEVLMQFNIGWQGTAHILQDAAQGVFKIQGLIDMVTSNDKDVLQSRMEVVEMGRSIARAIMLDAEMEDFDRKDYSFAGIPEVLQKFMLRLSAAARMPVMVLMGQSPSGLNASGDTDLRMWYDQVRNYTTKHLEPTVYRLYELIFAAQDFEGERPESFEIHFPSLWQLTEKEQAEYEKTIAEKDKIYIDAGVLLPEEVAVNRFKATGFSAETQVDMDAREEMLEAEIELAKEKAGEEPEPMMPQPGQQQQVNDE